MQSVRNHDQHFDLFVSIKPYFQVSSLCRSIPHLIPIEIYAIRYCKLHFLSSNIWHICTLFVSRLAYYILSDKNRFGFRYA